MWTQLGFRHSQVPGARSAGGLFTGERGQEDFLVVTGDVLCS
jgi:hypothetical protein